MFGQKRIPSREGGVEIVVEELCTRMVALGHNVTCYNRGGHHVSGSEYDSKRLKEYKGIRLKTVPTIEKKGLTNTTAMRGFWCIIVILVHIPAVYQNRIQDLMGSFAYIGVTFFFMTSAYGLKVGAKKNPDSTKVFWRRRLPKLLIPMFLVNVLTMVMHLIECKDISPLDLLSVNMWVAFI